MNKLEYFKNLDGLRAIAAVAVLVAHFFVIDRIPSSPLVVKLAELGNSGVSLFFVLSGFVITRILLNTVNGEKYFLNFYGRRTLRIFPLYYISLICYYYLLPFLQGSPTGEFSKQWYYYFYLQNFARTFRWDSQGPIHFWSLAVEEHFYLIWPALVYLAYTFNKNRLLIVSVLILLFSLVLRYLMLYLEIDINLFTFTRIDQLSLGCILAILERKGILAKVDPRLFFLTFVVGILFVSYASTLGFFYMNLFKHNAFGLLYFGLVGFLITTKSNLFFNKFLTSAPMQYLGKISYGFYVWHILAMSLQSHFFRSFGILTDFGIVIVFTIILSSLSFYLLELKFLKLKKYFQ